MYIVALYGGKKKSKTIIANTFPLIDNAISKSAKIRSTFMKWDKTFYLMGLFLQT